jgi:glycosyltransferase involved in cell wall biosynthesis
MTSRDRALISVVVPSYNQGGFIAQTLDSILSQDYRPLEVLVVDGASKDDTVKVLESYRGAAELTWWSEPDRGVVEAVNKGLTRARGEIIGIQSSDDIYLPGALPAVMEAFAADEELALLYGDIEYMDAESRVTGVTRLGPFDFREYVGKLSFIPQPAAFFTAKAARAAGPWREDVSYAADAEFFLRIAAHSKVLKIDRLLAGYRYHEGQRDKAGERIILDWARSIESYTHDADSDVRRHARSGIDLVRHHYTPERRWLRRTAALYRAILANPALLRRADIRAQRELLPGRYPIWRVLSRIKRLLGFKPRT